jgi:mycothiol synthase
VVGYAFVDLGAAPPTAQLVVDPAARRRGLGRRLLDEAVAASAREAWAHGDLPAARALAAAAGFVPVHELWRMGLDLRRRPAVAATLPREVVVRPFLPGHDEAAWLAVNARAFADHPDQGRWTRHDLLAREREPWFDPAGLLLAERDGELVGFVWTKVHPAGELGPDETGEIYVLGVDPAAQGTGLGRALTAAGLDHLAASGRTAAVLWVAGDNAAAIRTYRRAGFERVALDVRYARRPSDTAGSRDGATMGS